MTRRRSDTMTEDERRLQARLEMTDGEIAAVGEVELCKCLWPLVTAAAISKPGGERSKEMESLRRRVRDIINALRIGYRSAILDSPKGYFFAADESEVQAFCQRRHKRAMTSLVIESIVKRAQPLEDGVQLFMEFLKSHEEIRRRIAKREGRQHVHLDPAEVVRAVEAKAWDLIPGGEEPETASSAD